jgi:hypothetical protein
VLGQWRVRRKAIEGEIHLRRGALELQAADVVHEVVWQLARVDQLEECATGVEGADDDIGLELGPIGQGHAGGPAVIGQHPFNRRIQPDLRAKRLGCRGQDLGEPTVSALVERPRPELAVVLAKRVEQQHQARALGAGSDLGADDPRRGQPALEQVRLEVVVQEVRGTPGQEPDGVVERALVKLAEAPAERSEGQQLLRIVAERVGRDHVQQRLDDLAHAVHVVAVLLVGIGVMG